MKVAIVHDWLTNPGGAEKVVLAMSEAFPEAPIYTSVYDKAKMPAFSGKDVRTTWLQSLPFGLGRFHKLFPILRVWAFRSLDLSEFDVILSSSSAEAKQVRKRREGQVHICYCHTPIRYYWSHALEYFLHPGFGFLFNILVRIGFVLTLPLMRIADYRAAQRVDEFLANSEEVKKRILKYYRRRAEVVYPPVDVKEFTPAPVGGRGEFFVTVARQVPYKRVDLAVQACAELGLELEVFGTGPEHGKLVKLAGSGSKIQFFDGKDRGQVVRALETARGFIFPAEEDFGIVTVEALAAGAPVVAYGCGGSAEIVESGVTGELFAEQNVESVKDAVQKLLATKYAILQLQNRAKRFGKPLFITKVRKIVRDGVNST